MIDSYYEPAWLEACALIEGGEPVRFEYADSQGEVVHPLLLRPVPSHLPGAEGLYDAVTPYGYGGPVILRCTGDRELLARRSFDAYIRWCRERHVVCQFVRFHPLLRNADDFGPLFQAALSRYTVATMLRQGEDPVEAEFGKSARKNLRRAEKAGISWQVTQGPDRLDAFVDVYNDTMSRAGAKEFYYFPPAYFETLRRGLGRDLATCEVSLDGEVIAAGLYLLGARFAHAHLSGTKSEFLHLSPAVVLKAVMARWCAERGFECIHYGGGVTSDPEDSLFAFKRQFTREGLFPFYVGKKIFMEEEYDRLCASGGVQSDFFPAYRSGL